MGSNDGPDDEGPQHKINLGEFSIERHKVTNRRFAEFLNIVGPQGARGEKYYDVVDDDARIHRRAGQWLADAGHENHPVVEASWLGANAHGAWRGWRLPIAPGPVAILSWKCSLRPPF